MTCSSRGMVLLAVFGLHLLLASVLLQSRAPAHVQADGAPLQVLLLQSPARELQPVPELKPELREQQIRVPMPEVMITITPEPVLAVVAIEQEATPPVPATGNAPPRTVTMADYLRQPAPVYPPQAKKLRQQGLVLLRVMIGTDGTALAVDVARSSGFALLDRAACEAVRRAVFKPYVEAGVATAVQVMVPVEFSLTQRLASVS